MILNLKKIVIGLLLLLSITIATTPIIVDSIIIALMSLLSLTILIIDNNRFNLFFKTYYPLIIYYVILLFGLIYSENLVKGFDQLEKKFAFIAFPIVFFAIKDIVNFKKVQLYFSFGVICAALFCDLILKIKYDSFFSFGYTKLLEPLDIDPTYFSMYLALSLTFLINELNNYTRIKKALVIITISYLLFFYLRVGSKIGLLILFVISLYYVFIFFKNKSKKTSILIGVSLCLVICISFFLPLTYNRFYAPIIDNNLDFYQLRMKFFNERYYAWKCSIQSFNKYIIWFGYGTGDDLDTLKMCYENYRRSYVLNSHNIYFSALMKNGLVGLFSLIFVVIQGFKINKSQFIVFSLIIMITGLTESILERQKGIIFFTLFCTLILTELQTKKENKCVGL